MKDCNMEQCPLVRGAWGRFSTLIEALPHTSRCVSNRPLPRHHLVCGANCIDTVRGHLQESNMTRAVLVSIVFFASTSFAADSSVLREIMGKSVYEDSGINELSPEQLQVLESWILKNAVGTVLVERMEPQPAPPKEKEMDKAVASTSQNSSDEVSSTPAKESKQAPPPIKEAPPPIYVKLAEREVPEEEEPITQKYVRIETLDERNPNILPDLIRSRIDGTFKGWRGKTRFKLENGEIWQQRQSSTFITTLESPEVIIKRGRLNFYTMEVPAIGRKVHVKRIR